MYDAYWDRRIGLDREGRRTELARAQENAAHQLGRAILRQSTERLSLTVSSVELESRAEVSLALQALTSEGVIRCQAGRYEFFHQTYAEYAVARVLNSAGTSAELENLRTDLDDRRSHFWPIARHLLLQKSFDNRFDELRNSVPLFVEEGARYQLLAALDRNSPALLRDVADRLLAHDQNLIIPQIDLLSGATAESAEVALQIIVPLIDSAERGFMPELGRAIGKLLARVEVASRIMFLTEAIDRLRPRRLDQIRQKLNTWQYVTEALIFPLLSRGIDPGTAHLLCEKYAILGVNAQSLILRSFAADTTSWQTEEMADAALNKPCPPELRDDEVVEVLQLFWQSRKTRETRGWHSWRDLLTANLGERWNNAQIKLIVELSDNEEIRDELLEAV
ncbi:hypothetical protein ACWIG5_39990, partial [Streptomyces lydicus]